MAHRPRLVHAVCEEPVSGRQADAPRPGMMWLEHQLESALEADADSEHSEANERSVPAEREARYADRLRRARKGRRTAGRSIVIWEQLNEQDTV